MTRPPVSSMVIEASTHARKNTHRMDPGGKRRPCRPIMNTSMIDANSGHIRSPEPRIHHRKYAE